LERVHPTFHFGGLMSRDELARQYASADIFIHPSLTETFGNVLTEAMASGLAVAAFDYAAARQFIRHRKNGLSVPRSSPDALVEAAVTLATRPVLREQLRIAAREALLEQSWDKVVARFETDLQEVIQQHESKSGRCRQPPLTRTATAMGGGKS
jgi:glycosyltransferase involved in cell wall biosynthesis